jgi:hypothetical protein
MQGSACSATKSVQLPSGVDLLCRNSSETQSDCLEKTAALRESLHSLEFFTSGSFLRALLYEGLPCVLLRMSWLWTRL